MMFVDSVSSFVRTQTMADRNGLYYIDEELRATMRNYVGDITALLDDIHNIIYQIQNDPDLDEGEIRALQSDVFDLYDQVADLSADYSAYADEFYSDKNAAAADLAGVNSEIEVSTQIETNEKAVNSIYLSTLARGSEEFNTEQQEILYGIATQCPLTGGNAVFKAIAMYYIIDPDEEFDLDEACGNNQDFEERKSGTIQPPQFITVFPNPANDKISVSGNFSEENHLMFFLYNSLGQKVLSESLINNSNQISIAAVTNGVYHYIVTSPNAIIKQSKISVIK